MGEMLGFVMYMFGVCLAIPLLIGIVLYILFKKDDNAYSKGMDSENYTVCKSATRNDKPPEDKRTGSAS